LKINFFVIIFLIESKKQPRINFRRLLLINNNIIMQPSQKKGSLFFLLAVLIILAALVFAASQYWGNEKEGQWVCQGGEWIAQGDPSEPRPSSQCGTNNQGSNGQEPVVAVENPQVNSLVSSPLEISGQVRGTWLFEATMPVYLETQAGNEVASSFVQTTEDWMTEELVSFSGQIEYEISSSTPGYLVFEKANPSGLPQNDDEYRMPIIIAP
jgi:hypothetical protein